MGVNHMYTSLGVNKDSTKNVESQPPQNSPSATSLDTTNITSQDFQQTQSTTEQEPDKNHKTITLYCANCGHKWVAKLRCTDRTCPECARRKIGRLKAGYLDFVQREHEKAKRAGEHGLKFLTLTLKNRDKLEGAKEDIVRYFHKLRRREPFATLWQGGFYAFQITNKGRGWNVHLHVLLRGRYIPQAKISKAWHQITGDSYICDIRLVGKKYRDKDISSPKRALSLILEYSIRPPRSLSVSQEAEYNQALFGRRVVQTWGSWHGQLKLNLEPFVCPRCGCVTWLSEFELTQLGFLAVSVDSARSPP